MIIEFLQPDADLFDGLTVINRAIYYAGTLGAAGLVMFLVGFGDRLTAAERSRVLQALGIAVVVGVVFSLLAWPLRSAILSKDGFAGMLRFDLYPAVEASRIGDAFYIRMIGLGLTLFAFVRGWGMPVAAVGAFLVCAAYAAMGHSMLYNPRQELALLVTLHLLGVAFWIGSLVPLRIVAGRADAHSIGLVMQAWARAAILVVPALVAVGIVGAWILVGRVDLLVTSWYGWGLVAKVAVVMVMLGFAAWNRLRLTPGALAAEPGIAAAFRRSLTLETVVALIVLYAAAEMVSVHPLDYGHRIPS